MIGNQNIDWIFGIRELLFFICDNGVVVLFFERVFFRNIEIFIDEKYN